MSGRSPVALALVAALGSACASPDDAATRRRALRSETCAARSDTRRVASSTTGTSSVARTNRPAYLERWTNILAEAHVRRLDPERGVSGDDVSLLDALEGDTPVLLALWATYCPPCLEEMAVLGGLEREGLRVAGLSLDTGAETRAASVLRERGVRYPSFVLDERSMKRVGIALDAGIPFTVVVDPCGRITSSFSGTLDPGAARREITRAAFDPTL